MLAYRLRRAVRDVGLGALLVASAVGVYVLVAVGATTGLLDGAAACRGWPTCGDGVAASLAEPAAAVALGHRLAALAVGGLLLWTAVAAWRRPAGPRVRAVVAVVAGLYPLQVALGALTATGSVHAALPAAHLVVGMAIFTGVTVGLLWHLERETPGGQDERVDGSAPDAAGDGPAPTEPDSATNARTSEGAPDPAPDKPVALGLRERAGAYLAMTKPRLMWLLCLVAVAAMAMAGGRSLDAGTVLATLAGGVLAVGASGTFNNVLERDVDRRMARTDDRPLVEGAVPVGHAVAFGLALSAASVAVFLAFVNPLAAALGVLAILFYSVVYTLVLKPNTRQNIVVGGAVGAFPALIGWAAVTETVGVPAVVLGAVVVLWTPAHFYNLAMAYRDDYDRADIPMLPVVAGGATTRRHVLAYLLATMLAAVALGTHARLGWVYAAAAVGAGLLFLRAVAAQYREPTRPVVMRTFHTSNAYLGSVLLAVVVDATLV